MSVHSYYSVLPKLLTTDARGFRMALMEFVSQLSMVPVPPAGSLGIVRCLLCTAVIDTPIKLSRKLETKCVPQLFLESLLGTRRTAIRELMQQLRRRQRKRQKSNMFGFAKQLLCTCITRASRFFVHFFAVVARLRRKTS